MLANNEIVFKEMERRRRAVESVWLHVAILPVSEPRPRSPAPARRVHQCISHSGRNVILGIKLEPALVEGNVADIGKSETGFGGVANAGWTLGKACSSGKSSSTSTAVASTIGWCRCGRGSHPATIKQGDSSELTVSSLVRCRSMPHCESTAAELSVSETRGATPLTC